MQVRPREAGSDQGPIKEASMRQPRRQGWTRGPLHNLDTDSEPWPPKEL